MKLSDSFTSAVLNLVDREREAKQLVYALFTREHLLLMGPAGTGKSQFAQNAFAAIENAKVFSIHLTKFMSEEYVFGPIDIKKLRDDGVVEHKTTNSILDADFAFLDEFFDASDVLLRTLLGVLNEREWHRGSQFVKAQLHTAIVTSNYQRENEVTQAVLDRFLFKAEVQPVSTKDKRIKMLQAFLDKGNYIPQPIISLEKLKEVSKQIEEPNGVKLTKVILEAYDTLTEEFVKETKKYISDRTKVKALKLLKCASLLDGRTEVDYKDLQELKYIYCILNKRIEEDLFDACYDKCIGRMQEELSAFGDLEKIEQAIGSLPADFSKFTDKEFINTMKDLTEYVQLLEAIKKAPTQKVAQRRDKLALSIETLIENNRDKFLSKTI